MRVRECFDRVRAIPGMPQVDEDRLLVWLNDCEGLIYDEIISTREGAPDEVFCGYDEGDTEEVLFAKDPYSALYAYYVAAQVYLSFSDMARYNNYLLLYRDEYEEFAGYYARTHRQLGNVEVKL